MASNSWQQSLKTALSGKGSERLDKHPQYNPDAARLFAPVISPQMDQQIDWTDDNDPLLRQFIPAKDELIDATSLSHDPVGDVAATQATGVIHKYHGRVLLIASGSCAVNCRYCFRRHFAYGQQYAPRHNWQAAINYLAGDNSIHEVILSGGDPLTLQDDTLQGLTTQLEDIHHIKTLRFHSRIPVVMPERIDQSWQQWTRKLSLNKVMVLHINHAGELSPAAGHAIVQLRQAGFTLLNQSVLLKGVNDSAQALAELSHALFRHRIMPYYLHQFDRVSNAGHFEVPQNQAQDIYQQLRQLLPGYLLPKWVQEIPGELAKTPLSG